MPIIDHNNATEVPWRPNYRKWLITEEGDGTTAIDASVSEVGIGTGAPLHTHEDDELIVILEGTLRVRIGDETHDVEADHTVVVPPGEPHGFEAVGDSPARIVGVFPAKTRFFAPSSWKAGRPPSTHSRPVGLF